MTAAAGPVTHGRVLRIALPIVVSNATVPLLGLVDTGVIGQLGQAAPIGAVGIGALVIGALTWVFGFLRMGTTGLVAQARGAGDRPEVEALLSRALLVGLAGGVALILLQPLLWRAAFALSPATPEVEALARQYLAIRVWSAPAAIAVFGLNGWLIGQERTRGVLAIQLGMNGLNIGLDLLFVLAFGWGVPGVAAATAISEWAGLGLGLWLCRDAFASGAWRERARVLDPGPLRRMAMVNRDILLRTLCLEVIVVSFLFWGARWGDVTLAATQVLLQFLNLTAYALDGFAFAAEALVGQAVGARALASLREGVRVTAIWGAVIAVVLAAAFALLGPLAIDAMTTAPEVRAEARAHLPWMVAAPVMGIAAWMLDGVFVGATRSRDMRNMMALALLVYLALAWPLMTLFGSHGLWAALNLSYVARAALLASRYPALERAASPAAMSRASDSPR